MKTYDVVIVGAGISGATLAERYANILNKKVLLIEKRSHIGGNCYDYKDEDTGILMNKYGAHLFHTNKEHVWEYINKFDKLTKKYHNNIKLLKAIEELENENILNGWIYKNNWQDCLEKKNCIKITVYFKELGFQKVELWNKKFNYLLDESWVNNIKVGDKYEFTIYKKEGFLPKEKILIKIK
jgi:monoamine oxidase